MINAQLIFRFIKKANFILGLILIVFFMKGIFLAEVHPLFDGQDEARHYNTIQYLSEPKEKTWNRIERPHMSGKENINDYNFSEEIIATGQAADFDKWRHSLYETVNFSDSWDGKNENGSGFKSEPYNKYYPRDVVNGSFYHALGSKIEKLFSGSDILTRFYSIRIFSVLMGVLAILFAFLVAKNIGFSKKNSLLLSAIVAFQPKLTDYMTTINYDVMVIPMFFLFTLGGVLALKHGLNWKNILIMLFSAYIAFQTKGTGIILFGIFGLLLLYFLYKMVSEKKPQLLKIFYLASPLVIVSLFLYFKKYLPLKGGLLEIFASLWKYLDESLTMGRFALSSRTYWGSLTWVDSWTLSNFTDIIWMIQIFAVIGLVLYFLSKKRPDFLPERKFVVFLIGMIVALQLGIRAFDWKVYANEGSLLLGTPGRYFLPNLSSHIILVFVGLGMLWETISAKLKLTLTGEKGLEYFLKAGLILMFSFSMYIIFDVIVYRYYF